MKRACLVLASLVACSFPHPPRHSPDAAADQDAATDAPVTCTDCELVAVEPTIANAGDTITLEGTFQPGAIVTFPGGATVPATVLGTHRATAVVPAAATAGALTVNIGDTVLGPVGFHRASFALGLQTFQAWGSQTVAARQMPTLPAPMVGLATVTLGGYLYVIGGGVNGGTTSAVLRAVINADGSLGAFATVAGVTLSAPRGEHEAVVAGRYVYVLGGFIGDGSAGPTNMVERAPIASDGSLGTFEPVTSQLVSGLTAMSAIVIGNSLYVIGGRTSSDDYGATPVVGSIQRATIAPDGTLGPFAIVADTQLVTPREHVTLAIAGNLLYVVGGSGAGGRYAPLASIESAPIQADGTLGAFAISSTTLVTARARHTSLIAGNTLYAIGGTVGSTELASVEAAPILLNGSLGSFATVGSLPGPRALASLAVTGSTVQLIGGYSVADGAGQLATIVSASIDGGGTLAAPAATATTLVTPRGAAGVVTIGNRLYVIGGQDAAASPLATVEEADIAPDGSLGTFSTVSGVTLTTPRVGFVTAVVGSYVYAIGGFTGSAYVRTLERAPINPDGTLGAFAAVSVQLSTPHHTGVGAILGSYLYVISGQTASSAPTTAIERAPIQADGSLGAFVSGGSLVVGRDNLSLVVTGTNLYVMGGWNGAETASVESAPINSDGTLGTFAAASGALTTERSAANAAVLGSSVYVFGGDSRTNVVASIDVATIGANGTLGAFRPAGIAMTAPRNSLCVPVIGNTAYFVGGFAAPGPVATVDSAALR